MVGRHKHITNTHALNLKCKEAAAALCEYKKSHKGEVNTCGLIELDIQVLKQWHHVRVPIHGAIGTDEMAPYLELNVDAEAIGHEATMMARCPKELVHPCCF